MVINEILENYPLRVALTDFCNLRCFFCSNEGMDLSCKNIRNANYEDLEYLLKLLKQNGLRGLSLTGGEPSLYPQIDRLLNLVEELDFKQTFFHTNGTHLTAELIRNHLHKFSKVAVSIHTIDFDTWQKLTSGPRVMFDRLMKNLEILAGYSKKGELLVEIKVVPMKSVNDSEKNIREILEYCAERNFKFKFLNFEPITSDQKKFETSLEFLKTKVEGIGGEKLPPDNSFRGQASYLPLNWYKYKNVKGVLIEIGCGHPDICRDCYKSNEIFVDPNLDLKPCHSTTQTFPLKEFIEKKQDENILKAIVDSRVYLKSQPGKGKNIWGS